MAQHEVFIVKEDNEEAKSPELNIARPPRCSTPPKERQTDANFKK